MIERCDATLATRAVHVSEILGPDTGVYMTFDGDTFDPRCGLVLPDDWSGLTARRLRAEERLRRDREIGRNAFAGLVIPASSRRRG